MAEIKTELVSFGSEHNLNAFWVRQIEESCLRKHGDKARDDAMSVLLLAAAIAKRFPTLSGGSQMLSVLSLPLMSTEFRILNRRSSTTFRIACVMEDFLPELRSRLSMIHDGGTSYWFGRVTISES